MYDIAFEADCGILRAEVTGCWDLDMVRRYAEAMVKEAGFVIQLEGRLKLLARVIDRSFADAEAAGQLREMVNTIASATPNSRVALVVRSAFMAELTGVDLGGNVLAFEDEDAARAWLTALDGASGVRDAA